MSSLRHRRLKDSCRFVQWEGVEIAAPLWINIDGVNTICAGPNTVTVNGQIAYRKGEYFWDEPPVNNSSAPAWQNVNVAATGQSTVSGNVFVPQTPEEFTYDADGNLTSDGRWTYAWDAENRLIEMTSLPNAPSGSQLKLDFAYDPEGRRIEKIVSVWNGTGYTPQSTNIFLYDGWNLMAEVGPNDALIRSYVWGTDLTGSPQGARGVGGLLEVSDHGTQTTNCFVAFDGNGNVSALVNAADGTTVANYEYGPFGEFVRQTGPMAKANPFRFSTKYCDGESGLLYYGYRYYNPSTGRWLSRDPLFADEVGTYDTALANLSLLAETTPAFDLNVYCFTGNSPVGVIDPTGFYSCGCHTVRHTQSIKLGVNLFLAAAKVYFQNRWTVRQCPLCCSDGSSGDTITTIIDGRITVELKDNLVQYGVVYVQVFGEGSGGGAIVNMLNSCTGITHRSGCRFYKIRAGFQGCATVRAAKICLRGYGLYTWRSCADSSLDTNCLQGRVLIRVTFLWRSYDYIIWQSHCLHP